MKYNLGIKLTYLALSESPHFKKYSTRTPLRYQYVIFYNPHENGLNNLGEPQTKKFSPLFLVVNHFRKHPFGKSL